MKKTSFVQYGVLLLLLLTALGALVPAPAAAQGTVDLVVNPSATTVNPSDAFSVTVQVQSTGQQMDLVEVHLAFDPSILQVTSLTPNASAILPTPLVPLAFDNGVGTVDFGAGSFASFPSSSFNLLTINFQAVAPGTTNVNFVDPAGAPSTIVTFGGSNVLGTTTGATVTVEDDAPVNAAPTVDAGADQTITLPTDSVNLDATVSDDGLPSGVLTLTWSVTGGNAANVSFSDASAEDPTVTFSAAGTYTLQLTADDGELSSSDSVTVTVNEDSQPVNAAPTVDAGANQTITLPTDSVNLDATVSDDGLPSGVLTLTWSVTGGNAANASFSDASAEDPMVTFSAAGTYTLQLTADDGALSSSDSVTITVNPEPQLGQAFLAIVGPATNPVIGTPFTVTVEIQAGPQQVDTGEIHLDFDPAVLQINSVIPGSSLPAALQNVFNNTAGTFDYAAGILEGTRPSGTFDLVTIEFQPIATGQTDITAAPLVFPRTSLVLFEGSDILAGILGDPTSITIEEAQQNSAPSVNAGVDVTITLPDNTVNLDATVNDDGLPSSNVSLAWTVTSGDDANVSFDDATAEDPVVTFAAAGVYELTLTADDGELDSSDNVTITVNEPVAVDDVFIVITPEITNTVVGGTFDVVVEVQSGAQQVDAVQVHLDFDPNVLQVVSLTPGTLLNASLLGPDFDNTTGEIDYAAGTLTAPFPSGTFDLLTITFEAQQITDASGTPIAFAPLLFPRETAVTFDGDNVLTDLTDGIVIVEDTATLVGSVTLEGRQLAPNSAWSVPLTVKLYEVGSSTPAYEFTPTTDQNGTFTVNGIAPGTYEIAVKNAKTLQVVITETLSVGINAVDFGTLLAGDANNDNFITLVDYSILANTFNLSLGDPGYDDRADFNENDFVTLADFSLLAGNFNVQGDMTSQSVVVMPELSIVSSRMDVQIPTEPMRTVDDVRTEADSGSGALFNAANDVFIVFDPQTTDVAAEDGNFIVHVYVEAGAVPINAAEMYIEYDPSVVQVDSLTVGTQLPIPLVPASFDNAIGVISFSYGSFPPFPTGDILLMVIEFIPNPAGGTTSLTFRDSPTDAGTTSVVSAGFDVLTEAIEGVINVTGPNSAPVAEDDAYATDEDTPLNVAAPGVLGNDDDPEQDSLTLSVDTDVNNGTLSLNADGSFTYTPDADFNGTDSFIYQISDGEFTDSATVEITVDAVNDAPMAEDDAYATDEDTPLSVAAPGVLDNDSDVDLDTLTVTLLADVSDGTLTLNADGSFDYTPDANFNGTDSFTYTVSDGALSDTGMVEITVNAVNDGPVADAGSDQNLVSAVPVMITLDGSGSSDADGSVVSYAWRIETTAGTPANSDVTNPVFMVEQQPGTVVTYSLIVTDDEGAVSAPAFVVVEVTLPPNEPPVADAGPDQTVTDADNSGSELVFLNGTGSSDSDGTIVSYVWRVGTTQIATGANTPFSFAVGTTVVELTVTDDDGATATDIVEITVEAAPPVNEPPVADAGPDQTVTDADNSGSELVFLNGTGSSDSDGTIVSYIWRVGATQIATGANTSFSFAVGTTVVELTVTDDDGATATDIVEITVEAGPPVNEPPVADAGPDQTVTDADNSGSELVFLNGTGSSDSDGTIVSYVWRVGATQIATGANTPFSFAVGTTVVELTVTDDDGATATDIVEITVEAGPPVNEPPVADAGPDQTVTDTDNSGSELVFLNGTGSSDSDGTIVSYIWRVGATQIATGANTSFSFAVGTTVVELTVTDDDGATATDIVEITVEAGPPVNEPPVADAGPDQTVTDTDNSGDETVLLDGTGSSDPDDGAGSLRYVWTVTTGATGVSIPEGATTSATLPVGTHTVELTVIDPDGAQASDTTTIIVEAGDPGEPGVCVPVYRVNAGGSTLAALDGGPDWTGQSAFPTVPGQNGTTSNSISNVPAGIPAALFQSERYNWTTMPWAFAVTNGDYVVNLYFAEIRNRPTGTRIFDVALEGLTPLVFDNLDIWALTGGRDIATVLSSTVTVSDGELNLEIRPAADNGMIKGIEIIPAECGSEPEPQAPVVVNPIADLSLPQDSAPQVISLTGVFSDPDGSAAALSLTLGNNSNPTLVSAAVTGSDLTLNFVPGQSGTADITVRATDVDGLFVEDSFTVTVVPPTTNLPPVADAGPDQTLVDTDSSGSESFVLDGSGSSDPDGSAANLRYVWEIIAGATGVSIPEGAISGVTLPVGTHTVQLTVIDGAGDSATDTAILTVNPATTACVPLYRVNAGGPTLAALDGGPDWVGQASYASVPGQNGTTSNSISSVPAGIPAALFQSERYNWTTMPWQFVVPDGTYEVRLYFAEIRNRPTGTRVMNILAEGVIPPGWANVDIWALAGGRDIATVLTASVTVNDTLLDLVFEPLADNAMIKGIEILPADCGQPAVPQPPVVVNPIADVVVTQDAAPRQISLAGVFSDPDGSAAALQLTLAGNTAPAVITTNLVGTELTLTFAPGQTGTANISIRATDADGLFVDDTFQVTINPAVVNQPPVANAGPDQTVTDNDNNGSEAVLLDGSGTSDPDDAVGNLRYVWEVIAGAVGTSIAEGPLSSATLPVGTHTVQLTVIDPAGNNDTDTVNITVNAGEPGEPGVCLPVYRVNAGGPALAALDGGPNWQAQADFPGVPGSPGTTSNSIANVPAGIPEALFQSEQFNWIAMPWAFPVDNGDYVVNLYFAEIRNRPTGTRVMNILAEGVIPPGWANVDIWALTGGRDIATVLTTTVSVGDGVLDLVFEPLSDNAMIKGIEIIPVTCATGS